MVKNVWNWMGLSRTVYTNNFSYAVSELCFWYVMIDIVIKVWF